MPDVIISLEAPNAPDLAEELAQRLVAKQLTKGGLSLTSFEHHATIDLSSNGKESVDAIDIDINDWITFKHSTLKKRRLPGKRQKLPPSDRTDGEIVCIEIRR